MLPFNYKFWRVGVQQRKKSKTGSSELVKGKWGGVKIIPMALRSPETASELVRTALDGSSVVLEAGGVLCNRTLVTLWPKYSVDY